MRLLGLGHSGVGGGGLAELIAAVLRLEVFVKVFLLTLIGGHLLAVVGSNASSSFILSYRLPYLLWFRRLLRSSITKSTLVDATHSPLKELSHGCTLCPVVRKSRGCTSPNASTNYISASVSM